MVFLSPHGEVMTVISPNNREIPSNHVYNHELRSMTRIWDIDTTRCKHADKETLKRRLRIQAR